MITSDNQTSLPLLYSYRRCPYAMRARMALLQAGRPFDVIDIVLRDKPAEMLALSPKGTVPVLRLPDGTVLDESWDIMRWAFANGDGHDAGTWWERAQSADNADLLARNDGEFKRHLDRYKYPERHPHEDREGHRAKAMGVLIEPLQQRLAANRFLGGGEPCAADIAIFPFVRQFAAVDPAWFAGQDVGAVHRWLSGWLESSLFGACMVKLPAKVQCLFPLLPTKG